MTEGDQAPLPTTIFHLEMCRPGSSRPCATPPGFEVRMIDPPDPVRNRELYRAVGGDWQWTDKLDWSDGEWRSYVCRDALMTYVGCLDGREVGYFELEAQDGGSVEIAYFGLFPENIGKGQGGIMLSAAVRIAWELPDAQRVWVHTCTHDHEHALENYLSRGFEIFRTEEKPGNPRQSASPGFPS